MLTINQTVTVKNPWWNSKVPYQQCIVRELHKDGIFATLEPIAQNNHIRYVRLTDIEEYTNE